MELDVRLCQKVGVSAAIVHSVIRKQCEVKGVPFEGHRFARMSIGDINRKIPFLSARTITRALDRLEEKGLVENRTFVGTTKWRRAL